MGDPRFFTSLTAQFGLACNLTSVYYLMTFAQVTPGWFFPQALLVYGPLLYLLNHLFLRRERTMRALVLLNLAAGSAMLAAYLRLEPWKDITYFVFAAAFLIWLTLRGGQLALNGPALRSILLTLDTSFLLLVLYTGYSALMSLDQIWSLPAVCGFCVSILAASSCRSHRPLGAKAWLAIGGAFGALLLVMLLFMGVAADPAGQFLVTVWNCLSAIAGAVGQLLLNLFHTLLSLFPSVGPDEPMHYEQPGFTLEEPAPAPEINPLLTAVLSAVLLLAIAALIFWGLRRMGTIRLQKRSVGTSTVSSRRERPSLLRGIWMLLCSWVQAARLRFALWKGRNTPKGLYFLLVRRCRLAPWHKHEDETPREFLLRLSAAAQDDAPLTQALTQLAHEVDAAFYSEAAAAATLDYAPMVRRRIGAAAQRQFIRDILSRLRSKTAKNPVP